MMYRAHNRQVFFNGDKQFFPEDIGPYLVPQPILGTASREFDLSDIRIVQFLKALPPGKRNAFKQAPEQMNKGMFFTQLMQRLPYSCIPKRRPLSLYIG